MRFNVILEVSSLHEVSSTYLTPKLFQICMNMDRLVELVVNLKLDVTDNTSIHSLEHQDKMEDLT